MEAMKIMLVDDEEHIVSSLKRLFRRDGYRILTATSGAEALEVLAANQGLYNGFLAAGLIWSLLHPNSAVGGQIATFFLICVTLAGLYGAVTASRKIAYVQALPAFLALLALHLM